MIVFKLTFYCPRKKRKWCVNLVVVNLVVVNLDGQLK